MILQLQIKNINDKFIYDIINNEEIFIMYLKINTIKTNIYIKINKLYDIVINDLCF